MSRIRTPIQLLQMQTQGLLTRLDQVKPLALLDASVPAASISTTASLQIEKHLARGRSDLRTQLLQFLDWLNQAGEDQASQAQRRYTLLRLRFNAVLSQFDIFADVVTQRSESQTGIWLSGLDAVARDAMALPGYYQPPPVICYLDRGAGAAIRRARTRLPGGGKNPVAIIRVPRERMIGSGIASSLIHEVGHQAAVSLGILESQREQLRRISSQQDDSRIWRYWERCISEIIADFWSVARVGIASTLGLMGVVSLPSAFVFRINLDDPHPVPWIRVLLSSAIGKALYPHPQWDQLAGYWQTLYPLEGIESQKIDLIRRIQAGIDSFVQQLLSHQPPALRGYSLQQAMRTGQRQPNNLLKLFKTWQSSKSEMYRAPPSLVFAVIGQAKYNGLLSPRQESELLTKLLKSWAVHNVFKQRIAAQ